MDRALPALEARIMMGGRRLAHLIKDIYAYGPDSNVSTEALVNESPPDGKPTDSEVFL